MKRWLGCLVVGSVLVWTGSAHAIEGLTGSTWGTVIHNFNEDRFQSLGNVTQGIDWIEKGGYRLNTYGALRWRFQSNEGFYFNAWGPALGASIKKGPVRFGAEYYWEWSESKDHNGRALIFGDWYYDWDLLKLFH
ncbi:MAG: hypothetical protein HY208_05175 [Nitrospirae bacterium]|nr:hypothetical protein [Nitrospirota bacterium]